MTAVQRSTITGARELEKVLKRLPGKIGQKVLLSSLRPGATLIKKEAKIRAPVKSGTLRDEIVVRKEKGGVVALRVGPTRDAFWGMFQEFGTIKQPARPWLRPAFDATKGKALDAVGKRLGKNVEKAAEKLAGSFAKSGLKKKRRR